MELAHLILEYIRTLAWPIVTVIVILGFRKQIALKIGDLKEATTPMGGASFFDRTAHKLEAQASDVAEKQAAETRQVRGDTGFDTRSSENETGTPSQPSPANTQYMDETQRLDAMEDRSALRQAVVNLTEPLDFGEPRRIAVTDPSAAVVLAYLDLERTVRDAWVAERMSIDQNKRGMQEIIRRLAVGDELASLVAELSKLRNSAVHSDPLNPVSTAGALDYVNACESAATAVRGKALSKLRHPSRAPVIANLFDTQP